MWLLVELTQQVKIHRSRYSFLPRELQKAKRKDLKISPDFLTLFNEDASEVGRALNIYEKDAFLSSQ